MVTARIKSLSQQFPEKGIDCAILSSVASLRYFSGYIATVEIGPSPFAPVPGVVLWRRDERPLLLLADMESTADLCEEIEIETFSSYTAETPLSGVQDLNAKLLARLKKTAKCTVGVESHEIPAAVLDFLRAECARFTFRDISRELAEMRMIKDEEEIQIIRECCALCDVGQKLTKKHARPGISEIETFAEVRKGMELMEGGRIAILADLVSGPRTAKIGGPPSARRFQFGDLVISDLVPRHKGYWGDSCNTCVVGDANPEQRKSFEQVAATLREAIEQIRPGLQACELDSRLRSSIRKLGGSYPHHSGHGLGLTWHEEPRIVPYNKISLQAGMVIAIEPGIYFDDRWGIRLEHTVLVTETGAELLTRFQHSL